MRVFNFGVKCSSRNSIVFSGCVVVHLMNGLEFRKERNRVEKVQGEAVTKSRSILFWQYCLFLAILQYNIIERELGQGPRALGLV